MAKTNVNQTAAAKAATEKGVRMYPRNSLKAQVRAPNDTLSAFKVIKDHFSS